MKVAILRKTIIKLLKEGHARNIRTLIDRIHPADVAKVLEVLESTHIKILFDNVANNKTVAKIVSEIRDKETTRKTLSVLRKERLSEVLKLINPDDSADILGFLPVKEANAILKLVKEETASELNRLLEYASNTAGGIMNTRYVALSDESTVIDDIKELRGKGLFGTHTNIYIVSKDNELLGIVPILDIFSHPPNTQMSSIVVEHPISIDVNVHQNNVVATFNRYHILEAPVIDKDKKIVGIITADDVGTIMEQELGKDLQALSGSIPTKNPIKARAPIIIMAAMLLAVPSYIMMHYIDVLETAITSFFFLLPIITILPAVAGFQASSSTCHDIDIGLVEEKDVLSLLKLELKTGLILGAMITVMFMLALYMLTDLQIKELAIATLVMFCNILVCNISGAIMPIILRRKNSSYILTSAPIITGLCVIMSTAIYFALFFYLSNMNIVPDAWNIF